MKKLCKACGSVNTQFALTCHNCKALFDDFTTYASGATLTTTFTFPKDVKNMTKPFAAIRERLEKATPGPWYTGGENVFICLSRLDSKQLEQSSGIIVECCDDPFQPNDWSEMRGHNADFISCAPTDIAKLLAALDVAISYIESESLRSEALKKIEQLSNESRSEGY